MLRAARLLVLSALFKGKHVFVYNTVHIGRRIAAVTAMSGECIAW